MQIYPPQLRDILGRSTPHIAHHYKMLHLRNGAYHHSSHHKFLHDPVSEECMYRPNKEILVPDWLITSHVT